MPPSSEDQPPKVAVDSLVEWLGLRLIAAERKYRKQNGRAPIRRLTRAEYEHTIGDLLAIQGAELKQILPEDGIAHDSSKHADTLDISYVTGRRKARGKNSANNLLASRRGVEVAGVNGP